MVSSVARITAVFRLVGIAMATKIAQTEQMKAIVLLLLVQKTSLFVPRAGPMPRPNALIRSNCVTVIKIAMMAQMKKMLAVSLKFCRCTF